MNEFGVYKYKDFDRDNFKRTSDEIFSGVTDSFRYAVIAYEEKQVKVENNDNVFHKTAYENRIEKYGVIYLFKTECEALIQWNKLSVISNKKYVKIALISRDKVLLLNKN